MANEIAITFNSFALDSTNNIGIESINTQVAQALREVSLPKADGSIIPIAKRKAMTIKFMGNLIGSNYDDLRTKLDSLKNALETTAEQNLTLDDDRFIKGQYGSLSYSYKALRTYVAFSFDVRCSYPFWQAQSLSSDSRSPTSGVGYTITNNGNAAARVKITFTNGGTAISDDLQIENTTTGQILQYRGSIISSGVLLVDNLVSNTDLTVTNQGVDDIVNFEGDFLTLNPGNNTIKITTGVSGFTVLLNWRDTYL